ncbi:hypothetical protein HNQ91_004002 [Filimonas zeae]|uniref:Heparinase II/III-like protein n=1 Tax=Filimonas zeae TaxID=1737353 RepID=A0A917J1P1_9BACT|nr:heparinase II/III family protein [Filimonas zeae]MDR6340929.1 hypothetical protein [Filimonas zeae]GGH77906.1 hypothetical protein GCM10011379_44960 [Filimonas zeae]
MNQTILLFRLLAFSVKTVLLPLGSLLAVATAQPIQLPADFSQQHPRLEVTNTQLPRLKAWTLQNETARKTVSRMRESIDNYVTRCQADSSWMLSRLQMYWKTRHTEVYIKGGVFDHAEGEAPVPTVRFPGARDHITPYGAPKPEDLLPYADDPRGVYLVNRSKPGAPMEWVEVAKTGRAIESVNTQLMGFAHTAAWLYRLTDDDKYARFAFGLFDTYMTGMHYRETPHDLTHGHHETIAGLATFEVIQEAALLTSLTGIYDLLYQYLQQRSPRQIEVYTAVFKKWAEVQINHGVAFNNWNLIEARNVLNIAAVLEDNRAYPDGKGRQYYISNILNTDSERQWSLYKLLQQGYDSTTGIWNECPGYSLNVLADFTGVVQRFDKQFQHDLLPDMPVLEKAVPAAAQYLFPNGFFSAFGDSHYGRLSLTPARQLLANAQLHRKPQQIAAFSRYLKTLEAFNRHTGEAATPEKKEGIAATLLVEEPVTATTDTTQPGSITAYVTPVFSAPKVSYLALRNGFDPVNGLMAALSGSKGNHMHAGGISMELFGKGMVLAPEAGIGTSYFQPDYGEYYSQFPAHNTVAVDGISAYPVMKSNHGFELLHSYPASGVKAGFFPLVSFASVAFLEPETQARQNRLLGIVRTSDTTGYYIDVFRSARQDGKDKMHDYFYHSMGQQLTVLDSAGAPLNLQPTERLTFAGGHLSAYDYFWDKKSVVTDKDIQAQFQLTMPNGPELQMHMWMKGEPNREVFAVKAPPSKAIDRMGLPQSVATLPLPTIIARQTGAAWNKPFTVVLEPATAGIPKDITAIQSFTPQTSSVAVTGLTINTRNGSTQWVFCGADSTATASYQQRWSNGVYGVISEQGNQLQYLFMGSGSSIGSGAYSITAKQNNTAAALCKQSDGWYFAADKPVVLTLPLNSVTGNRLKLTADNTTREYTGKTLRTNGGIRVAFTLPAVTYSKIQF